jgi:hypothetical protein
MLPTLLPYACGLALTAALALGAHPFAGGTAFFNADRTVAVGVDPREEGKGARARFLARHAAVAVGIGLTEHGTTEAGEHAAALAAAAALATHALALGARFAALGTVPATNTRVGVELGAADHAVAVAVELREALGTALDALALARTAHLTALAAAGLGDGTRLFLGDEAVAIGIDAGEAGIDTLFNNGAGQRLGVAGAQSGLGKGGGGAEHRKRGTGKDELLHDHTPVNWGKNLPRKQAFSPRGLYLS